MTATETAVGRKTANTTTITTTITAALWTRSATHQTVPTAPTGGESTVVTDSPEETETTTGIGSTTVAGHGHPARAESA